MLDLMDLTPLTLEELGDQNDVDSWFTEEYFKMFRMLNVRTRIPFCGIKHCTRPEWYTGIHVRLITRFNTFTGDCWQAVLVE